MSADRSVAETPNERDARIVLDALSWDATTPDPDSWGGARAEARDAVLRLAAAAGAPTTERDWWDEVEEQRRRERAAAAVPSTEPIDERDYEFEDRVMRERDHYESMWLMQRDRAVAAEERARRYREALEQIRSYRGEAIDEYGHEMVEIARAVLEDTP